MNQFRYVHVTQSTKVGSHLALQTLTKLGPTGYSSVFGKKLADAKVCQENQAMYKATGLCLRRECREM